MLVAVGDVREQYEIILSVLLLCGITSCVALLGCVWFRRRIGVPEKVLFGAATACFGLVSCGGYGVATIFPPYLTKQWESKDGSIVYTKAAANPMMEVSVAMQIIPVGAVALAKAVFAQAKLLPYAATDTIAEIFTTCASLPMTWYHGAAFFATEFYSGFMTCTVGGQCGPM